MTVSVFARRFSIVYFFLGVIAYCCYQKKRFLCDSCVQMWLPTFMFFPIQRRLYPPEKVSALSMFSPVYDGHFG